MFCCLGLGSTDLTCAWIPQYTIVDRFLGQRISENMKKLAVHTSILVILVTSKLGVGVLLHWGPGMKFPGHPKFQGTGADTNSTVERLEAGGCEGSQNVKRYQYQYFFRYQISHSD